MEQFSMLCQDNVNLTIIIFNKTIVWLTTTVCQHPYNHTAEKLIIPKKKQQQKKNPC